MSIFNFQAKKNPKKDFFVTSDPEVKKLDFERLEQ